MTKNNTYNMYPYHAQAETNNMPPLTLRATREEAAAKGWDLDEQDVVAATHVAIATRIDWESSHRPLSAQAAGVKNDG